MKVYYWRRKSDDLMNYQGLVFGKSVDEVYYWLDAIIDPTDVVLRQVTGGSTCMLGVDYSRLDDFTEDEVIDASNDSEHETHFGDFSGPWLEFKGFAPVRLVPVKPGASAAKGVQYDPR